MFKTPTVFNTPTPIILVQITAAVDLKIFTY